MNTLANHRRPRGEARPSWVPNGLFPFESHFIDIHDARLHYVDEGDGPTLLFVHGSPMWSFMYREAVRELRSAFRCVAVDLPGLGLSKAPVHRGEAFRRNSGWIEDLVDALDLRDLTLVVHATAGPSALDMALRQRERLRGLIVSNSFAWPLDGNLRLRNIVRVVSSAPFAFVNRHANFLVRLTARFGRRTGPFSEEERAAIVGPYRSMGARGHLANIFFGVRVEHEFFASVEARLDGLSDLPVLFLYGAHDNGYAAGFLDRWKSHFPRHEAVVLPESGHFPFEDEPGKCVGAMRVWLERTIA